MAAVPLFRDTNMVAVTSRENSIILEANQYDEGSHACTYKNRRFCVIFLCKTVRSANAHKQKFLEMT